MTFYLSKKEKENEINFISTLFAIVEMISIKNLFSRRCNHSFIKITEKPIKNLVCNHKFQLKIPSAHRSTSNYYSLKIVPVV